MIHSPVKLTPKLTVGPSPSKKLLKRLAKDGYLSLINLSRDGEMDQSLPAGEERRVASELGLQYVHAPVSLSNVKDQQITEFCEAVASLPKPIYVHCRLGQRAGPFALIYVALRRGLSADAVLRKAKQGGLHFEAQCIRGIVSGYLRNNAQLRSAA